MVLDVIAAVARLLRQRFGYDVYQDDVAQGLNEPCFFIVLLEPSRTPRLGKRSMDALPLDVHYFPRTQGDNGEMYGMAAQLLDLMEFLPMPDGRPVRGLRMRYEAVDGVLHFFVQYNLFRTQVEDLPEMEALAADFNAREG